MEQHREHRRRTPVCECGGALRGPNVVQRLGAKRELECIVERRQVYPELREVGLLSADLAAISVPEMSSPVTEGRRTGFTLRGVRCRGYS
jgi:hypothetical protein